MRAPQCPRCGSQASVQSTAYGPRHSCCGLWSWGGKPLVDKATHEARKKAHAAFDELWKSRKMSRGEAYRRLADAMSMTPAECHIALMTEKDAKRVVDLVPTLER